MSSGGQWLGEVALSSLFLSIYITTLNKEEMKSRVCTCSRNQVFPNKLPLINIATLHCNIAEFAPKEHLL